MPLPVTVLPTAVTNTSRDKVFAPEGDERFEGDESTISSISNVGNRGNGDGDNDKGDGFHGSSPFGVIPPPGLPKSL